MIPNLEKIIKALKFAGFTDLQAKVLAIIFRTNQIQWSYLIKLLEEKGKRGK